MFVNENFVFFSFEILLFFCLVRISSMKYVWFGRRTHFRTETQCVAMKQFTTSDSMDFLPMVSINAFLQCKSIGSSRGSSSSSSCRSNSGSTPATITAITIHLDWIPKFSFNKFAVAYNKFTISIRIHLFHNWICFIKKEWNSNFL